MALAARTSFSSSALWVALEVAGGAVFSSLGLIVIAGLIGPADLGLAAIALGLAQTLHFFPETLYHDAIIQRRHLNSLHIGSAFWSVLALGVVLGGGMALLSGWVGRLYGQPELSSLLLALAVVPVGSAISSIQSARLRRAMRFRALSVYAAVSRALATATGLVLALCGFGAWAIVAQYGLAVVIVAILYLVTLRWRFVGRFSLAHARELSGFGLRCTTLYFVDAVRGRLFFALLGQYLSLPVLGQLNLAWRVADSLTTVMATGMVRLYLPVFSRVQGDARMLRTRLRESSLVTAALLTPLFAALAVSSEDLVRCFGSAKWQGIESLVPWLCIGAMATIIRIPAGTATLALGRPLAMSSVLVGMCLATLGAVLVVSPVTGVGAVMCWVVPLLVSVPIYMVVASRTVGVGIRGQLAALVPAVLSAGAVVAAMILARRLVGPDLAGVRLVQELAAAGAAYLFGVAFVLGAFRRSRGGAGAGGVLAASLEGAP